MNEGIKTEGDGLNFFTNKNILDSNNFEYFTVSGLYFMNIFCHNLFFIIIIFIQFFISILFTIPTLVNIFIIS